MSRFALVALFFVCLFAACTKQDTKPLGLYTAYKNVAYGPDTLMQNMDIYVPNTTTKNTIPVMILLHGGGWISGDKNSFDEYDIYDTLIRQGYAIVNMNYRLAPQFKYPAPLDDIDTVINYLQKNKLALKINPDRICLLGRSSGGHIALQYGYTRNKTGAIKAIIDCFGIPDLTDYSDFTVVLDTQVASFMGVKYLANEYAWHDASPIYHMNNALPTAIFHGSADGTVNPLQSVNLKDTLQAHGVPYKFVIWNGFGHAFDNPTWQTTILMSTTFIQGYVF